MEARSFPFRLWYRMDGIVMSNRRDFLKTVTAASSVAGAPALLAQQSSSKNINVAVIGVGTRGIYLLEEVQRCPGVTVQWIADLYDANMQRAVKACKNPKVQTTKEWEKAATASGVFRSRTMPRLLRALCIQA